MSRSTIVGFTAFVAALVAVFVAYQVTRPQLAGDLGFDCGTDATVFLPPAQGPDVNESESIAAAECIMTAYQQGDSAFLHHVTLGAEGERLEGIIHTKESGRVDYVREVGWWAVLADHDCETLVYLEPGFFEVDKCG